MLALLLPHVALAAIRSVAGSYHVLPEYAPENQAILDLQNSEISDTYATFGDAFQQNLEVEQQLARLVSMPYFSTYKVDLSDHKCPLEHDTATCANRQCAIEPLSSHDIDSELFEQQYLGRLRKDSVSTEAPRKEQSLDSPPYGESLYLSESTDRNYCYPEDESVDAEGVYVDLQDNSERFTGYSGEHANLMWQKVYGENCFGYYGEHPPNVAGTIDVFNCPLSDSPSDLLVPTEECVEQRLFYKLLSGMHASISTHLTFDFLNISTKKWEHNLPEWLERVGWHEDRLDNMFFDYVLISRAVAKLVSGYERQLQFSSSNAAVDADVRVAMRRLGLLLSLSPLAHAIDEHSLFLPENIGHELKNEFRQRVKNVNALMSCVGCERCRLWGKIQTAGYGTALKILFELPNAPQDDEQAVMEVLGGFRRSELIALINTFARISHSVHATDYFRHRVEDALIDKSSFKYQWRQGMAETREALRYIFKSYTDLPKNIWVLANFYLRSAWKRMIGSESDLEQAVRLGHIEL